MVRRSRSGRIAASVALPLAIGLIVAGVRPAASQALSEALSLAYQNNPTLDAARAGLRATDERLPQALSQWRPTVNFSSSIGRSNLEAGSFKSNTTPRDATVTITQPLFSPTATPAIARSKTQILAERARLFGTEQTVLLNAATAYFNLLREQATLDLQVKNEQVLSTQLDATRDRFRVGEVTRTDVSQAEAALAGAVASRTGAEGNLSIARATFLQTVGIQPGAVRQATSPDALLPKTLADVNTLAATNNPAVIAAQFDENTARTQIDEVTGNLLPTVNLVGQYDIRRGSSTGGSSAFAGQTSRTAQITAQLNVPLYEAGSTYSQIRQQKQIAGQARIQIDVARRNAIQTATSAYESLTSARARLKSLTSQIEANSVALEGVRQEANVGARTVLDILNAEQTLLNSQVSRVQAERDSLVAAYEVLSAIGRLTAKELDLSVALYDYEAYFRENKDSWIGTGRDED